jgi:hypothetical protein
VWKGVERRPEHPVELRRDHDVAWLELGQQPRAIRPLADRLGAGHAFIG